MSLDLWEIACNTDLDVVRDVLFDIVPHAYALLSVGKNLLEFGHTGYTPLGALSVVSHLH